MNFLHMILAGGEHLDSALITRAQFPKEYGYSWIQLEKNLELRKGNLIMFWYEEICERNLD